jgi:protein tyrosine/serine phosphatase
MHRNPTLRTLLGTITLIALTSIALAGSDKINSFPSIHIKNFGQMDARFYRGAQPKADDYKDLAALGIKTIIDLREKEKTEQYAQRQTEASGMRYINIPIEDKSYPSPEQVQQFLKIANDPATGVFYVHCAGGRHRTGIMGAVYRFNVYHWNYDQVYSEMKTYDFYSSWGHGSQKQFVQDYWANLQAHTAGAGTTTAVTSSGRN